jgi:hypothetical protein
MLWVEAVHWSTILEPTATDAVIMAWARARDFGHPQKLLVRAGTGNTGWGSGPNGEDIS